MRGAVDKMLEFSLFQIKNNVTLSGITQNVNSQQADFRLKSNDYPPFLSMTLPIIYTPDGKVRTYKVFSAGVVKDTADNYKLDYATDADYEAYLKLCEESSNYKVEDVELTAQSQIVSLSTCTNVRDDERFLVQGVLTAVD